MKAMRSRWASAQKVRVFFGYVGVYSPTLTVLAEGEAGDIVISLDGNAYSAVAVGVAGEITPGYSGGVIELDNPEPVADLVMTVQPGTPEKFEVSLARTKRRWKSARPASAPIADPADLSHEPEAPDTDRRPYFLI